MFDAQERLVVANAQYAAMYGHTPEELKPGTTLREVLELRAVKGVYAGTTVDAILAKLRERIARKRVSHWTAKFADGRTIAVSIQPREDGSWVNTHLDITEHERVREQFDAALSNMVEGLAMFDADQRLIVANQHYAEIYGLSADEVKPGTSLRQILEYRIAKDDLQGNADDILKAIFREVPFGKFVGKFRSRLKDGRCIEVSVGPTASGGTVTTHHDITEQRQAEARIAHLALHDALTGLANRTLLNERLQQALTRVARNAEIVAVLLLDLDHFKKVNDSLGHPAGDKLLKMVGERLRGLVRETDTIARLGGDEFAIVQVAIAQPCDATALARRIIEAITEPYDIEGHQVTIGTSVGIAIGPANGSTTEQLMQNADLALYRAKRDGRGTFRLFEEQMDAEMQRRCVMERELRQALVEGQFELHYQPQVNLAHNQVCGFEALLRWRHPAKGMVAPDEFIPLAEKSGFIVPLGEWVMRQACATAASWPDDLRIAVNVSPKQLGNPALVQVIASALGASGLSPRRLEVEITESALLTDNEEILATLASLRKLGVRIAVDDFGIGFSSLNHLRRFRFDKVKIDRSLVESFAEGGNALDVVRAVALLAKGLGIETTAEGVETQAQLEGVKAEGCTEMQGFHFSRPLPASQIEQLYVADLRQGRGRQDMCAA